MATIGLIIRINQNTKGGFPPTEWTSTLIGTLKMTAIKRMSTQKAKKETFRLTKF
jgi:hypothetical protein